MRRRKKRPQKTQDQSLNAAAAMTLGTGGRNSVRNGWSPEYKWTAISQLWDEKR